MTGPVLTRGEMRAQGRCGDCGVGKGEHHTSGCDTERCMLCGGQMIGCSCVDEVNGVDDRENEPTDAMWAVYDEKVAALGGREVWAGEPADYAPCRAFGWWSRWEDGTGWVRCAAEDAGAGPDLNRLGGWTTEAEWSPERRSWLLTASGRKKNPNARVDADGVPLKETS